ncbi:hypothetical protein FCIRC_8018 [Fusarium circinatum]|uniref:Ankyrin n=1 Tax=Fusarium circinatum TaxID=48490 RepID=A0A8H5TJX1_FUSCI|nr:hypothetical protein FCIRC_8018 [Fusarium circinatum]
MDQVRKKDVIEAEWLRNYRLIRNLYLSDMSLNDLVYWLGIFENFTVTLKSQLEYRLKKWNISKKNIDHDSWRFIDQTVNQRKREGKESDVLLCGKRVKQSTIDKETNRHRDTRVHAQSLPGSHAQSIASSDQLIICTPQAYLNDFEWPETLPWFKFRSKLQESTGTTNIMIPECLKLVFYKIANNMVLLLEADDFDNLYTIISKTGLLGAIDNLRRAREQDLTIRAFTDKLFRSLITSICHNKRMVNKENPKALVEWLLSLGQDPNIDIRLSKSTIKTALEYTILSRQVDMIEQLLKAGAVVGTNRESSNPRSILSYVLPDRVCDNEGAHIIRLVLGHYKVLTAEEILHAAILLQDKSLFEQALDIGADISLPIETLVDELRSNVVKEETALSTAASVSIHATSVVFALLKNQNQAINPSTTLLFIPIVTEQLDILQYLLANGLEANLPMTEADFEACRFLVPKEVHWRNFMFYNKQKPQTILELLLQHLSSRYDWNDGIKLLIRAGAVFPAESILELTSAGNDDIISAALDAGSDPSVQSRNGYSALALAILNQKTNCVQLFLERGAERLTLTSELLEALVPAALLLKHWTNIFNTSKDGVPMIDAAIIIQDDVRLKSAFSELPAYYSPSSLCCAVLLEDHLAIDFLLKNRSPQAPQDVLEGTAVGLAAMLGNLRMVRELVAQLQKPETALLPFCTYSNSFMFSRHDGLEINPSHTFWANPSHDNGNYDGFDDICKGSPLALAISYRGTAGVLELLRHGYQPDDITWARAFDTDTQDCLKALMDHSLPVRSLQLPLTTLSPLLLYAIRHEMEEIVVWLMESGADVNENDVTLTGGRSPVQFAIETRRLTMAESLLRSGANINAAPSFFAGVTALQCAAIKGYIGLVKQLLDAGARVNARGSRHKGRTALEGAAEHGRLDMVEVLLHHGALTTGPGKYQFIRAIHFAERQGHYAIAALLRQSREWTDEDTHTRDSICVECELYFFEPRPSGQLCRTCNSGYATERYCCDEIHMPEDSCYHCYTEDEESRYELEIKKRRGRVRRLHALKERMEFTDDDRSDSSLEDIFSRYTYL